MIIVRLFAVFIALFMFAARAQPARLTHGDPVLFVIDASQSMARYKTNLRDVIAELVRSGAGGQLRRGCAVGIWTFNDRVTELVPPKSWSPEKADALARAAAEAIDRLRFQKLNRLDRALHAIVNFARESETLTVFLFSDGDGPLTGTPFDATINQLYRTHRGTVRRNRRPFVTTLALRQGAFVTWSVGIAAHSSALGSSPADPAPAVVDANPESAGPDPKSVVDPAREHPVSPQPGENSPKSLRDPKRNDRSVNALASITTVTATPAVVPEQFSAPLRSSRPNPQTEPSPTETHEVANPKIEAAAVEREPEVVLPEPTENLALSSEIPAEAQIPAQSVAAAPVPAFYLVLGTSLLAVALGLSWWALRAARPKRPSVISRSIDRR